MNLNRIDLNLLVYLDALLRERNVTQAANQLNLSQPAMSNGLRRLRELLPSKWANPMGSSTVPLQSGTHLVGGVAFSGTACCIQQVCVP